MKEYEPLTYIRDELVDGVGPWYWVVEDSGAWEGPHNEFVPIKDSCLTHVKDRLVCVQAGGNLGMYPRLWSNYFANVFTFEPDPLNFYVLSRNCQKDNIFKYNAALGNESTMSILYRHYQTNVGMHSLREDRKSDTEVKVKVLKLDDFNLGQCDLIQLDVEGYEFEALMGAYATISKFRPVISTETYDDKVRSILDEFGYRQVHQVAADRILVPS